LAERLAELAAENDGLRQEIEDRNRAEQALQDSERRVRMMNPAAQRQLGGWDRRELGIRSGKLPMAAREQAIPIIRTKLHRPPVTTDLVCRAELHAKLDTGSRLPLTIVSAPAGYGKSTLLSHWSECCDGRSAWLSLDEADSDIRGFCSYFVR
jgi:hypothetical protein